MSLFSQEPLNSLLSCTCLWDRLLRNLSYLSSLKSNSVINSHEAPWNFLSTALFHDFHQWMDCFSINGNAGSWKENSFQQGLHSTHVQGSQPSQVSNSCWECSHVLIIRGLKWDAALLMFSYNHAPFWCLWLLIFNSSHLTVSYVWPLVFGGEST